jgi:hypothetical protein
LLEYLVHGAKIANRPAPHRDVACAFLPGQLPGLE